MITFSRLGSKGNLGNQLFQIASVIGLGKKYGHEVFFPEWKYEGNFRLANDDCRLPSCAGDCFVPRNDGREHWIGKAEPYFHYCDNWRLQGNGNYDINGWLQSEKYWADCKEAVKTQLSFRREFVLQLKEQYKHFYTAPTIAISVRRGDFVGNPNYDLLPASYYYLALLKHFPNYQLYNIILFSDDISYCKVQFEGLPNVFFAEGCNAIEQLCLMSMCDNFIIANSTFSWWGAYLGEKAGSKVIRPAYLFAGKLLEDNSDEDYWPEHWTCFDHKGKKLDLMDVTFTIPVMYDHPDRKENMGLSVCMLQRDFNTNIIVGEQGGEKFKYMAKWCAYENFSYVNFHRTRMLNQMALQADTPIVVNWDCDVFIPALQVYLAVELIRKGADMVYPYDGRFARVPRLPWFKQMRENLDLGIFGNTEFKGKHGKPLPVASVGGAIVFKKAAFIAGGMENEHMISFGPEDTERMHRFTALGFKVRRITGTLYHMDHWCGPNSSGRNSFFKANHAEWDKEELMTVEELKNYVEGWGWLPVNRPINTPTVM